MYFYSRLQRKFSHASLRILFFNILFYRRGRVDPTYLATGSGLLFVFNPCVRGGFIRRAGVGAPFDFRRALRKPYESTVVPFFLRTALRQSSLHRMFWHLPSADAGLQQPSRKQRATVVKVAPEGIWSSSSPYSFTRASFSRSSISSNCGLAPSIRRRSSSTRSPPSHERRSSQW